MVIAKETWQAMSLAEKIRKLQELSDDPYYKSKGWFNLKTTFWDTVLETCDKGTITDMWRSIFSNGLDELAIASNIVEEDEYTRRLIQNKLAVGLPLNLDAFAGEALIRREERDTDD